MSDAPRVSVTLGTESYVLDRDELTLSDLYMIKSASDFDSNDFFQGISAGNPAALQTLIWFLRRKVGIQGDRLAVDFKLGDLNMSIIEGEANPTPASSGSDVVAISDASPTTAT